jgi:glyoxylase-like metal-dependent hydrolase (beta-lactamase superfamily II)/ferredoxin
MLSASWMTTTPGHGPALSGVVTHAGNVVSGLAMRASTVAMLVITAAAVPTMRRMARLDQEHPLDETGEWFVDTRCIDCDVARQWAPGLIRADEEGLSYMARQPASHDEEAAMWRAAEACPTQSIGHRSVRRPPTPAFPFELTPGVLALGHNDRSSFGAHSYLVTRADGNLLVDSPRFLRSLAERVDDVGGIAHVTLSHRDDVADTERWAERYGARVWIHAEDAAAAPFATDVVDGIDRVEVAAGVVLVPVPGHTRGSVVFHVDDRWLFTGDTLHWNRRRRHLDVFPRQTWYSWECLADSMDVLARLRVEWVFPGHGMWWRLGAETYAEEMAELGPAMRQVGRSAWSRRAGASVV